MGRCGARSKPATNTPDSTSRSDPKPAGCQKGACFSDYVNAEPASRTRLSDRRARRGKRERISWDEALTEIAEEVIDAVETRSTTRSAASPRSRRDEPGLVRRSWEPSTCSAASATFYDWYSRPPAGTADHVGDPDRERRERGTGTTPTTSSRGARTSTSRGSPMRSTSSKPATTALSASASSPTTDGDPLRRVDRPRAR